MKIDYEKLFQTYGIDHVASGDEHCTEGWISLPCPFCSPDKYHLGVNLETGKFHCWACGGHSSWQVLSVLLKKSQSDIHSIVSRFITAGSDSVAKSRRDLSLDKPVALPAGTGSLQQIHKDYIHSRGFSYKKLVEQYNIKATTRLSPIGTRIVIPIFQDYQMISWTARLVNENGPRYLKCPKHVETAPAKNVLYGWNFIKNRCVVVEGIFDMWRLGAGAVATMGLGFSPGQVELLSTLDQVFILFDTDKPAKVRADNLAKRLSALVDVEILEIEAADPAELSDKEARAIMKELGFYHEKDRKEKRT